MASQAQSRTQPRIKAWLIIIHVAAKFPTLALLECSRELQSQTPGVSYAAQHSPSVWLPAAVITRTLSSTYIPLQVFNTATFSCDITSHNRWLLWNKQLFPGMFGNGQESSVITSEAANALKQKPQSCSQF